MVVSLLTLPLVAQAPTLTAAGTLVATFHGVSQTFGPGPIPAAGATVSQSGVGLDRALAVAEPLPTLPAGTAGIRLRTEGGVTPLSGGGSGYASSNDVVLTIGTSALASSVLQFRWQGNTSLGLGTVSIDIGDDGSNEFTGTINTLTANRDLTRELAVPFGATVRVRQSVTGSAGGFSAASGRSSLDLIVFPATSPVTAGTAGCFAITHSRPAVGSIELRCTPPSGSATLFLFGTAPANGTLPWAPSCPLLLQMSSMLPAAVVGGTASLTVQDALLPPGVSFYTQAISVVQSNDVRSTGALVMTGS